MRESGSEILDTKHHAPTQQVTFSPRNSGGDYFRAFPKLKDTLPPAIKDIPKTLEKIGLPTDMIQSVMERILEKISPVVEAINIPKEVKDRLMQFILEGIDTISSFSRGDILEWAKWDQRRSLWIQPDPSDPKWFQYYLGELLGKFQENISNASLGIVASYGPKEQIGRNTYDQGNYRGFLSNVSSLDSKNNLAIWTALARYAEQWSKSLDINSLLGMVNLSLLQGDLSRENLSVVVATLIFDGLEARDGKKSTSRLMILQRVKAGNLELEAFKEGTPEYSYVKIIKQYLSSLSAFQYAEKEINKVRQTAEGKNDFLGASTLVTEHMFKEKNDVLKNGGFAELIKLFVSLGEGFWFVGNILSAQGNITALRTGMNTEGHSTNKAVAGLLLMTDVGMITVPGVWLLKTAKGAQALAKMKEIITLLPAALEKALKVGEIRPANLSQCMNFLESMGSKLKEYGISLDTVLEKFRMILSKSQTAETSNDRVKKTEKASTTLAEWRLSDAISAIQLNKSIKQLAQEKWITENAARILKIQQDFPELRSISPDQAMKLIQIHTINTGSETVGNYGLHSLGLKQRWANELFKKMGISVEKAGELTKKLIQWGYLGEAPSAEKILSTEGILGKFDQKLSLRTIAHELWLKIKNGLKQNFDPKDVSPYIEECKKRIQELPIDPEEARTLFDSMAARMRWQILDRFRNFGSANPPEAGKYEEYIQILAKYGLYFQPGEFNALHAWNLVRYNEIIVRSNRAGKVWESVWNFEKITQKIAEVLGSKKPLPEKKEELQKLADSLQELLRTLEESAGNIRGFTNESIPKWLYTNNLDTIEAWLLTHPIMRLIRWSGEKKWEIALQTKIKEIVWKISVLEKEEEAANRIRKMSPEALVDWFLNWEKWLEKILMEKWSPANLHWNKSFLTAMREIDRAKAFQFLEKWSPEFFTSYTPYEVANFIYLFWLDLGSKSPKDMQKIDELFGKWGKYAEWVNFWQKGGATRKVLADIKKYLRVPA